MRGGRCHLDGTPDEGERTARERSKTKTASRRRRRPPGRPARFALVGYRQRFLLGSQVDLDEPVLDPNRVRLQASVRGKRRRSVGEIELPAVQRATDGGRGVLSRDRGGLSGAAAGREIRESGDSVLVRGRRSEHLPLPYRPTHMRTGVPYRVQSPVDVEYRDVRPVYRVELSAVSGYVGRITECQGHIWVVGVGRRPAWARPRGRLAHEEDRSCRGSRVHVATMLGAPARRIGRRRPSVGSRFGDPPTRRIAPPEYRPPGSPPPWPGRRSVGGCVRSSVPESVRV